MIVMKRTCAINGCEKEVKSKGYCEMHYYRLRRHGSPHVVLKPRRGKEIKCRVDENGCHIITSHSIALDGYARIQRNGKTHNAHRVAYMEEHGEIPKNLVVRHKCDVRSCVNIDHLELGTHKDNAHDMVKRNRHHYGEINKNSKLTEKKVLQIRKLSERHSQRELARMYGVGKTTIARVQNRETWVHI